MSDERETDYQQRCRVAGGAIYPDLALLKENRLRVLKQAIQMRASVGDASENGIIQETLRQMGGWQSHSCTHFYEFGQTEADLRRILLGMLREIRDHENLPPAQEPTSQAARAPGLRPRTGAVHRR